MMRKLKIFSTAVIILVLGWFLFASVSIYDPRQGDIEAHADAVVSLSPPPYRLPLAEELYHTGHADNLAISYVPVDPRHYNAEWVAAWQPAESYCEDPADERHEAVWCLTPEEISTRGEALALRELAQTQAWESVTIVTSRSHVFRTRFIFERCAADTVDVNVVFPEPDVSVERSEENWAWHIVYENAAFFKALYATFVAC
ncbi:YdcF family protein [Enteractinococcus fodinae]|uniref:DUF218 domain-containing protein n=1 Tax=Enteractinococcus fodinae TaxID=684663 RepID=A0ABU2AXJ5_9MICC|nr:YdcF family protein [Enteractinococcus fodinae]MDR7346067.1 hypothetical protein [Enteractinococcus fodinae]